MATSTTPIIDNQPYHVITPSDALYPASMKAMHTPPTLYVAGNVRLLTAERIAAVITSNDSSTRTIASCEAMMREVNRVGGTVLLANTIDFGQFKWNRENKVADMLYAGFVEFAVRESIPTIAFKASPLELDKYASLDMTNLCIVSLVAPASELGEQQKGSLKLSYTRTKCVGRLATAALCGEVNTNGGTHLLVSAMSAGTADRNIAVLPLTQKQNRDRNGNIVPLMNMWLLDEQEAQVINKLEQVALVLNILEAVLA